MTQDPNKSILATNKKGNDLEKALLDPARLSRTGAGPVLAARGFGFEEWAAPVEPRWDRSQEPPNGLREAKSPPNTPTPDGPWAPSLPCLRFSLLLLRRALASFRMP